MNSVAQRMCKNSTGRIPKWDRGVAKKGSREKDRLELSLDTGVQDETEGGRPKQAVGAGPLSEQEPGLRWGDVRDPEVTGPTQNEKASSALSRGL